MYRHMQAIVGTQYFKNSEVIAPGKVGSVGDVIPSVRFRQSAPDMAMRYDKNFSGASEQLHGSNVQDGFSYSFTSGGGPSRTIDSRLERKSFKTNHGWMYQDLRAPDKTLEPIMGSTGRYSWYNKLGTVYQAKVTGNSFLPLPGNYGTTSITRGNQIPRILAVDRPTVPSLDPKIEEKVDVPKEEMGKTTLVDKTVVGTTCYDSQGKPYIRAIRAAPPGQSQSTTTQNAPPTLQNPPPSTASKAPEQSQAPPPPNLDDIRWTV